MSRSDLDRSGRRRARRFWWERVRPFWQGFRWPFIAILAVLALVLGGIGFDSYLDARGVSRSFWHKVYLSLQLYGLESGNLDPPIPLPLEVARLLAPIAAGFAAFGALAAIFRQQIARWFMRLRARDHVIVCGLGRAGRLLSHEFRARGQRVIVIDRDPDNPAIGECRQEGAVVLVGDATDRSLFAAARVDRARYLFAVTGDDGINAQIGIDARALVAHRRPPPLACFVRVLDADLAELLDVEMATRATDVFRLEFFNPSERGAPALLNQHPPFDEKGETPIGPPHSLVVGLGEMGSRLILHIAGRWKAISDRGDSRVRVTVADRDAVDAVEALRVRHPMLDAACEVIVRSVDVKDPEFDRAEFLFDPDGRCDVTSVYVCLGDDTTGLAAGLRLRRRLRERAVPIVVRTKQHGGLASLFGDAADEYENLHAFGLLELTCRPEVLLMGRREIIARAAHEEYIRKQRRDGQTAEINPSIVPWVELPEHLKESNRAQADDIGNKLRTIGCAIEPLTDPGADTFHFRNGEIELLARKEHDRWWREREKDGWKFAPEKDVERKKSPYLIPWDELPEEIKDYDRGPVAAIPMLLAKAGFRVVRVGQEVRHDESGRN
jgi:hypothetical protein